MTEKESSFTYRVYPGVSALAEADQKLIQKAASACTMAYAPYSGYKVGAAIFTTDKKIIVGSNQENGAFPIGQCAERVALYNMIHTLGRQPIDTMAVVVDHRLQSVPASPCGSCRQILSEYRAHQSTPIRLLLAVTNGEEVYEIEDVNQLLPLGFDASLLASGR